MALRCHGDRSDISLDLHLHRSDWEYGHLPLLSVAMGDQ